MQIRFFLFFVPFLLIGHSAKAQDLVNGDFENNTGVLGNTYTMLTAPQFDAMMPGAHSSGNQPNLDIISTFIPAQSGHWSVGITPKQFDLLALRLTAPLVPGDTYSLTFYDRCKEMAYPLEIGMSGDPDAFGDLVYTAPEGAILQVWTARTFTFVAPNNGQYIMVRMQTGDDPRAWAAIDHFTFESDPCHRTVDLGNDRTLCPGRSLVLTAGGGAFASYLWADLSTGQTREVTEPGTYRVTGFNGACSASDTVLVTAGEVPEVAFVSDVKTGCGPLDVVFAYTGLVGPGATFGWNLGDETTSADPGPLAHTYTEARCYSVSLTVTSADQCAATLSLADYVCVQPAPVAQFDYLPETVLSDNPQVQFVNTSTGNVQNVWDFGDGTTDTQVQPLHNYPLGVGAEYPVRLVATSENGCSDTAWQVLSVKYPFAVYVPNTFTPDGDNLNPRFMPVLAAPFDVTEYRFEIFDRWGERIFASDQLLQGWDGTRTGTASPGGVYEWKMTVRNPYTEQLMVRTGDILLLR